MLAYFIYTKHIERMNQKYIIIAIIIVLIIAAGVYYWYYYMRDGASEKAGVTIAAPATPATTGTAGSDIAVEKDGIIDHKIYPKFLKISLDNTAGTKKDFNINLMEVKVYDVNNNNVARGAPVTTSGDYDSKKYPSSYLVDDNESTMAHTSWGDKTGIELKGVQWMNITLPGTTDIKDIVIVNRPNVADHNYLTTRFVGANIQLLAKDNSPIKAWTISEDKPRYELSV